MNFREFLKKNIVLLDGGTGTILMKSGLKVGEYPERLNLTNPNILIDIHKAYYDAGSNVAFTNTFGANAFKFGDDELEQIVKSAVDNVKKARELSCGSQEKFVALDIGPTGKMLKPFGDLEFNDAVEVFKKTIKIGVENGVDLIVIETMNDSYEAKAAVIASKECCDLPILVSCVFGKDGLMMTGANPQSACALFEGLGVDGFGANCSLGPIELSPVIDRFLDASSTPILFKPNAGLPKVIDGKTVYDITADQFTQSVFEKIKCGARIVGGCCGTTPEYIQKLAKLIKGFKPNEIKDKNLTVVSSYSHQVVFDKPIIIGERINPTGKKRLKQAIVENDMGYILQEAVNQQKAGADILDVNVGIPEIDETKSLTNAIKEIQAVVDLPLQIDTVSKNSLEQSLRIYNGKPMINSVNGKQESMDTVFPLAKKYGGLIVCLTLDENGIPDNAKDRVKIAEKIVSEASKYGIKQKDLIFDTLTMTISSNKNSAQITLDALKALRDRGFKTILGVSNISFGLPNRDFINASFYNSALNFGLTSAIINPFSQEMMKTYYSYCALNCLDENYEKYISFATGVLVDSKKEESANLSLSECIIKGFKDKASFITQELLKTKKTLDIINEDIIPALDVVGKDYEDKKIFLPQLLISAECAKASFEIIKASSTSNKKGKAVIVLATVKGDIHDIGKNIVKLMLENYGFDVIDLGKDVEPETILQSIVDNKAPICGLSALMTTTVKNMETTIELIKRKAPWCKTIVGGAVLTKEYAQKIGADKYAKDAMETVRYAEDCTKIDK